MPLLLRRGVLADPMGNQILKLPVEALDAALRLRVPRPPVQDAAVWPQLLELVDDLGHVIVREPNYLAGMAPYLAGGVRGWGGVR